MKVPTPGEWIQYLRDLIDDTLLPTDLRIAALKLISKEATSAKEKVEEDTSEDNHPRDD